MNLIEAQTVLILGPNGSGKTTIIRDLLAVDSAVLLDVHYVHAEAAETHQQLKENVDNFLSVQKIGIMSKLVRPTMSRKVLVFDDVDIILTQDRFANAYLQTLFSEAPIKGYYVVASCSSCEERRVTDLKKLCKNVVRLSTRKEEKYADKNIYELVHAIFEKKEAGLEDLEVALSSDPTLISYLMYDNWIAYCGREDVLKHLPFVCRTFKDMSLLPDGYGDLMSCFAIRLCLRDCASPPPRGTVDAAQIKYTQVTSRSAQHYNLAKKHMALPDLTYENVVSIAELHRSRVRSRSKVEASPLGGAVQAYLFNLAKNEKQK